MNTAVAMNVPLLDLRAQYRTIKAEMLKAVESVLEAQQLINGPEVKELEKQIAAYCHTAGAVGMASGTDALLCTLMAMGIGKGDEVITTPYTFFATAGCIWRTGARPVFVDIDPATFNLDVTKLADAVTARTRAILPVHLFGQMAEMQPILMLAEKHSLAVIEDACQSIGATQDGKPAGSLGDVGCFSFFPSKNLGGLGDGGMCVTQHNAIEEKLRVYREHGSKPKYIHRAVGGNFRLDTIQAAGLLVKLKHLDNWSARRRHNAAKYDQMLKASPAVKTPVIAPGNLSVFNQYVIRVPQRDALQAFLAEQGVGTAVYYPLSLHEQECFKDLGHTRGDFPESERAAAETLALPIYAELKDEHLEYVAAKIVEFYSR